MCANSDEIHSRLRIIISTQTDGFAVVDVRIECDHSYPPVRAKNILPLRILQVNSSMADSVWRVIHFSR